MSLDVNRISYQIVNKNLTEEREDFGKAYIKCPVHGFEVFVGGMIKTSSGSEVVELQSGWFDQNAVDNYYRSDTNAASKGCANNLKQIGLAFRLWSSDHDDKYPFNVSTNGGRGALGYFTGGTMELCQQDSDGYEKDASVHFLVMSNECNSPRILICPADSKKHSAISFQKLLSENVTYKIHSGANISELNPHEILVYCPIHGHVVYCDGSVWKNAISVAVQKN